MTKTTLERARNFIQQEFPTTWEAARQTNSTQALAGIVAKFADLITAEKDAEIAELRQLVKRIAEDVIRHQNTAKAIGE